MTAEKPSPYRCLHEGDCPFMTAKDYGPCTHRGSPSMCPYDTRITVPKPKPEDTDQYIISGFQLRQPQKYVDLDFIYQAIHAHQISHSTLQQEPAPEIRSMREDEDGYISWQRMNEKALADHDAAIAAAAIAKDREHILWLLTRNGYKGAEAFLKQEFDGGE